MPKLTLTVRVRWAWLLLVLHLVGASGLAARLCLVFEEQRQC